MSTPSDEAPAGTTPGLISSPHPGAHPASVPQRRRFGPLDWVPREGANDLGLIGRALLLAALILAGDRITVLMGHQGWTLDRGAVVFLRLLSALPVLRFPFEGLVVALEVDKWDWFWLAAGQEPTKAQLAYQEWDKFLDLFPLTMALVATWRWRDLTMKRLLIATFALRVVGVTLFLLTPQRWLLIVFPNVFENLILVYAAFRLIAGHDVLLTSRRVTIVVGVIALMPKMVEEYFLHFLERRPWDWVNLPIPDGMEPRVWVIAMYFPLLVTVLYLVWRPRIRIGNRVWPARVQGRR
ncbi:MAG: hypothetical protein EPO16_07540 [Dehalococcoidia bacterium]|nr:MAG: hypothetical protein EPO16_07540 [Dehalococcoidia bacterium]